MSLIAAGRFGAFLLVTVAAMTACGDTFTPAGPQVASVEAGRTAFHGTLLDPPPGRPQLTLRDTDDREFSLTDRPEDEVTVVFFGYTHCPDVCPTTMADLAAARRQLPPDVRRHVTVAFITEDPQRDTPEVLRQWLNQFDSTFIGLLGANEATQAALAELHLPQSTQIPQPDDATAHPDTGEDHHGDGGYSVEHSGIVYAFGPAGTAVIYTGGTSPSQYAEDFTRLVDTG